MKCTWPRHVMTDILHVISHSSIQCLQAVTIQCPRYLCPWKGLCLRKNNFFVQQCNSDRWQKVPFIAFMYENTLLCRLRSIAAHRDHFVRRLSVRPCVCLSSSHTFLVVTHSYVSQATHAFLGMQPLCYINCDWTKVGFFLQIHNACFKEIICIVSYESQCLLF